MLANGTMSVSDKADNPLYSVPLETVLGIYASNGKQPMWMSPEGPAAAMKVDAGTLGFLKGGRNWLVFHTKAATLVFQLEDVQRRGVLRAVEEHSGHGVEQIGKEN
jgi:hypothetical protein